MKAHDTLKGHHEDFLASLAKIGALITDGLLEAALTASSDLAFKAWVTSCGIYASPELEKLLARISDLIPHSPKPKAPTVKRKLLTVMSSAFSTGGHSRLAWRLIQLDKRSEHTLVLTQQENAPLPDQMIKLQDEGQLKIICLDDATLCSRVTQLRQLLEQADYSILLTHPHDVIPCAAVPALRTPPVTIYINHATHAFWVGASISHLVLEVAPGVENRRGIPQAHILQAPLPLNLKSLDSSTPADIRTQFGIPADAVLFLSVAAGYKFLPIEGVDLPSLIEPALGRHPRSHLIIIGTVVTPQLDKLSRRFPGRVHIRTHLLERDLVDCYHACDIYLDPAPVTSLTTMLEVAAIGKPIVRYAPKEWRVTGFSFDYDTLPKWSYIWSTPEDYCGDIDRLVQNTSFRAWRSQLNKTVSRATHADDSFSHVLEMAYETASRLPRISFEEKEELGWRCGRMEELLLAMADNMVLYSEIAAHQNRLTSQPRPNKQPLQTWLEGRIPSAAQDKLILNHLAQSSGLSVTIFIAARAGEDQQVANTLQSLLAKPLRQLGIHIVVIADDGISGAGTPPTNVQWAGAHAGNHLPTLNQFASQSTSDWLLLVDAGEVFTPSGLLILALELLVFPDCRAVYADELVRTDTDDLGKLFRPSFNLDMLLSCPTGLARHWLFRRDVFLQAGGFDPAYGEAPEFELLLRLIDADGINGLGHVSEPLLISNAPLLVSHDHEVAAITKHLHMRGYERARVEASLPGRYRLHYGHAATPLVSIIIPTKDQFAMVERCVSSLLEKTVYQNYEILLVDNNSTNPAACSWLDGLEAINDARIRVLRYPHPFNYSAINNMAAAQARGEYLVLLNNDTAILRGDWLDALLNHAQRPEVGIVGGKLLYPNGTIQHAGVVLGLRGPAEHPFNGVDASEPGYMHRLEIDQNYNAVTGACLMVRRSLYDEVGGLDENDFKVSYNDVDLCLKVRNAGYLIVWTPHSVVLHEGNVSQKQVDTAAIAAKTKRFEAEQDAMYRKWLPVIARDTAYNQNLSLHGSGFEVETELELNWNPLSWRPLPVVLAMAADQQGCGHYRIIHPGRSIADAGLADVRLSGRHYSPAELERMSPDSWILQRQVSDEQIELIRRNALFTKAFKVAELDDYLPNLPMKNAHRTQMPKDIIRALRRSVSLADRFVVSTESLAEALAGLNSDTRVVLNRLPPAWWRGLQSDRRQGSRPRVGWAGGSSHQGDLELIIDVVKELKGEVDWVFFGMCPEQIRPYLREFHGPVPIERYPRTLASLNLDLALAPLEQNLFNECKSNLRLLEYGSCGYPVVCSDVRPYQGGLPVTLVKNRFKDWVDAIRSHTHDLDAAARAGDCLKAEVERHWMLEGDNLNGWLKAWLPD